MRARAKEQRARERESEINEKRGALPHETAPLSALTFGSTLRRRLLHRAQKLAEFRERGRVEPLQLGERLRLGRRRVDLLLERRRLRYARLHLAALYSKHLKLAIGRRRRPAALFEVVFWWVWPRRGLVVGRHRG